MKKPIIWQLSVLNLPQKTLIAGVILRDLPRAIHGNTTMLGNLRYVLNTYFCRPFSNQFIQIKVNGQEFRTKTDAKGGFELELDIPVTGGVHIFSIEYEDVFKIIQGYPIYFHYDPTGLAILSDIDDTIMVSHSPYHLKRVSTVTLKPPHKRKSIDFTGELLRGLRDKNVPVLYVSKSEGNLFDMISSFIEKHKLPKGHMFLTPYLRFKQLFTHKKSRNFKLDCIRYIIRNAPGKRFLLLGDDGQKDMEIYASIAEEFPDMIEKIYIRQAKRKIDRKQRKMWNTLNSLHIPFMYFGQQDKLDITTELKELRL